MGVKSPMDTRSTYPFSANHSEDLSLNPFDFFGAHSCKSFSLENQPRDFYSRMHVSSWYALVNLWLNPKRKISDGWLSEIQILILYCQILYILFYNIESISVEAPYSYHGGSQMVPQSKHPVPSLRQGRWQPYFLPQGRQEARKGAEQLNSPRPSGNAEIGSQYTRQFCLLLTQMEPVIL